MNTCELHDSAKFLAGEMSASEVLEYESHLETCPHCCRRLEESSGSDDDWRCAQDLLRHDSWARTGDWQDVEAESLAEAHEAAPAIVLSFLAPTEDPAMLGRVGPYEIAGVVGRGGAGIVLKGYDRSLGRNVAIKVLDPALAGVGAARQRFSREARAMAAISHEHVAPVYEVSEHAGLPYLVMEYVPGGSLERRLRATGPFDVVSIVRIGLQTAQALDAAHRQGLVHRDIKPGNILLDRGTERVRVADFGLARVANDVSYTKSGFIAGTPQFMSPEQVRAEACDAQSDLFSLGAVLYALGVGHAPFRAETVYGVMQRIVHDQPRPIREQNALIPVWLEAFIFRLLEKDRTARFASAEEVARILHDELAHLQSPTPSSAPKRPWLDAPIPNAGVRRRRTLACAAAVVGAIALVVLTAVIADQFTAEPSTDADLAGEKSASAPSDSQARPEAPSILSWDRDGTSAAMSAAAGMKARWTAAPPPIAPDLWAASASEVAARLDALAAELEPPPANDRSTSDSLPSSMLERKSR